MSINARVGEVTERIIKRSRDSRSAYVERMQQAIMNKPRRTSLGCANLAHGFAACPIGEKNALSGEVVPNLGIITSYNDMLSAHQPYERYPELIRKAAAEVGAVAQVAGGVPAMCDGVTQGFPGMDLSLFSRDVIGMSTAIGLSHDMYDAAVFLGVCDKIVPGLAIGALTFSHLPAVFIPAGPMPSGISNEDKSHTRQLYAEGKVGRAELLASESAAYHSPGTCTFYGTANSNQMLMEIMGLHMPGSSFVNPNTPLRDALTKQAVKRALSITALGNEYIPIGKIIDERAIVNGVVGLHATGGSTNHTMHLVAIAAAAGITLTWDDISDLSDIIPLLTRVYPNGQEDVNAFQAAGGMGFLMRELLDAGLLHEDVTTVNGKGLRQYTVEANLADDEQVELVQVPEVSRKPAVLTTYDKPFQKSGGLKVLSGNLGKAVIKISAVKPDQHIIEAPARVFHTQEAFLKAFSDNELNCDMIAVVRFMGPKACGMPEAHKLTPALGVLQGRGYKVALVTDGRMSGASGKIPAAIHVTPEAAAGGLIGKIKDGDIIRLDAVKGTLDVLVSYRELDARRPATTNFAANAAGTGRELFAAFRAVVSSADTGARTFGMDMPKTSETKAGSPSQMETI
ncbi:phosphogluconate dehydratase [Rhodobacteraceae bacterium RKSG542]|uniref:phosphogluconate dehydratase n=1 Tax=Pseudovibrio flavus TaxID=2529854 RepID=UPI0012BBFC87|nr:phosphogluconate dehydratase [Pseudovibrio flavus]MTI19217.1 phosphogluconate dehydratase [Pseudovibrio flavus]